MHETALLKLMVVLDDGTNMLGELSPEIRSRLYAVVNDPNQETWSDAHSIMINSERFLTLWKACLRYTDYAVTGKTSDEPWPAVPTAEQLMTAIQAGIGAQ